MVRLHKGRVHDVALIMEIWAASTGAPNKAHFHTLLSASLTIAPKEAETHVKDMFSHVVVTRRAETEMPGLL